MITFSVLYSKNKSTLIQAKNLDEAEKICNNKYKTWTEIRIKNDKNQSN